MLSGRGRDRLNLTLGIELSLGFKEKVNSKVLFLIMVRFRRRAAHKSKKCFSGKDSSPVLKEQRFI